MLDNEKLNNSNKNIETYKDDVLSLLETNQNGVIKELIKQGEEDEDSIIKHSPESTKNKVFLFLGILFFLFTIGIVSYLFLFKKENSVSVKPQFVPLLFLNQNDFLEINEKNINKIAEEIFKKTNEIKFKDGETAGIYLIENNKQLEFKDFIFKVKADPSSLNTEIFDERFLFGVLNTNGLIKSKEEILEEELSIIKPIEIPKEKEEIKEEEKPVTLNNQSFFKTGTIEFIDQDAKNKAKQVILDFLKDIDLETFKIKVVGTYSVERPWIKNEQIAEDRMKLGVSILKEVLFEKYSKEEIEKVLVESSYKGVSIEDLYSKEEIDAMNKKELLKAIDLTQGVQYFALAKIKKTIPIKKDGDLSKTETEKIQDQKTQNIIPFSSLKNDRGVFILIKPKSFDESLPVMKSWERKMFLDFHEFFGISITKENSYFETKSFEDDLVFNKNARILYDDKGRIIIMYVFADDNSIIITRSRSVAKEIILRLIAEKNKK